MTNRRLFLQRVGLLMGAFHAPNVFASTKYSVNGERDPASNRNWAKLRNEFNLDYSYAHFAGFLLTSHPKIVRDEIAYHRARLDKNPAEYTHHEEIWKREDIARERVAEYLGAKPSQIALTGSTTAGLGAVYNGISLKPGQEILTTAHDHYSTKGSLRLRSEKDGAVVKEIILFKDARNISVDEILANVSSNINAKTKVLAFTWVHSGSGIKLPIAQIGNLVNEQNKNRDSKDKILFCVDGVHGLGIENFKFADLNCDYFIAGTHKWMFGPRGTGIICARSDTLDNITPTFESFSSYDNFGFAMTPGGYHAFEHQWSLPKAFEFHMKLGKQNVQNRIHGLNTYLKERLQTINEVELVTPQSTELSSGFTFFRVKNHEAEDIEKFLKQHKVIVNASERDVGPVVRMAPGLINTTEEIDRTISLLKKKITKA